MKKGYNCASVMSSKHSGVSAAIKEKAIDPFYVHFSEHCFYLMLVEIKNVCQRLVAFFASPQQLQVLIYSLYVLHHK